MDFQILNYDSDSEFYSDFQIQTSGYKLILCYPILDFPEIIFQLGSNIFILDLDYGWIFGDFENLISQNRLNQPQISLFINPESPFRLREHP